MRRIFTDISRAFLVVAYCIWWGFPVLWKRCTRGYAIRRICESMGVTYVKLGQYLAIRYDLLPEEVCRELSKLLNEVAPLDLPAVRRVIERELGRPLESIFASLEERPVGAASIAQVHRARSMEGEMLAVKVQRPGAEAVLQSDIRNLLRVAWLIDRGGLLGAISMRDIVHEVAEFTLREVDFVQEGRMADQVRADSPPFVRIPRICWHLTTRHVLTMEFIEGVSLLDLCGLADTIGEDAYTRLLPGVDPALLVPRLAEASLRQIFVTGRFHGDPHLANVIIGRDGTISFIDFGIFGTLDARQRANFAELMASMTAGFEEKAYRCYLRLATPTLETDRRLFRRDMTAILRKWRETVADPTVDTAGRLAVGFQTQVLLIMRRHHVKTEPNQILVWRTLGWLDVMANRLPGDFDMLAVMRRFFHVNQSAFAPRFSPIRQVTERLEQAAGFLGEAPRIGSKLASRPDRLTPVMFQQVPHNDGFGRVPGALVAASLAVLLTAWMNH